MKIPVKVVVGLNTVYYGGTIFLENENFSEDNEQESMEENISEGEDDVDPNDPNTSQDQTNGNTDRPVGTDNVEDIDSNTQNSNTDRPVGTDNVEDMDSNRGSDEADRVREENDQLDLTEDDVTDEDRKKHKKIGDSIERSLKQDSDAETFDEFYAEKVAQAKALENQYQPTKWSGADFTATCVYL